MTPAQAAFIRQLAVFLVENQAGMSLKLQMGQEDAKAWAALRRATPIHGYPSVDEAEATLADFLELEH